MNMKIHPEKLDKFLSGTLAPVYLIAGNEPLLINETADAVRHAAVEAGFGDRELLSVERGFDWNRLAASASNMSLFGDRQLVELRMPTGKPGRDGSAALVNFVGNTNPDILLLVLCGKLDRGSANSKWVKALDAAGVFVQIYPVGLDRLPGWIGTRMRQVGLIPDREAIAVLVDRVEGNLLAAKQEIDKLLLLNGPGNVDADAVTEAVADSSRFDVFQLVDSVLEGNASRGLRILDGLHAEGMEPPLIVWALSRELRSLAVMAHHLLEGKTADAVMSAAKVWPRRRSLIDKALQRHSAASLRGMVEQIGRADRMSKGALTGNAWEEFAALIVALALPGKTGTAA